MYPTYIWHLLHLHWRKTGIVFFFAFFISLSSIGQDSFQYNLPFSDSKWLHYGFSIGLHTSSFQLKYSDEFVTPEMDSVHSIMPAPVSVLATQAAIRRTNQPHFSLAVLTQWQNPPHTGSWTARAAASGSGSPPRGSSTLCWWIPAGPSHQI